MSVYTAMNKVLFPVHCTKPRVRDAKYFREQMLLAIKDETRSNLNNEENDFLLDNSYGEETMEELTAAVMLMARIQPTDGNPENVSSYDAKAVSETSGTHDEEAGSSRSKCPRKHETVEELLLPQVHHEFLLWEGCNIDAKSRVREAESEEEVFTLVAWIRAFHINELIYAEFYHEFYSTYKFNEVCTDDELESKKITKFRLGGRAYSLTLLEFAQRLGLYQAVELEEDGFNVYFFVGGLHSG
ncbi:hypothetical protein Tco_0593034 [Tanacetum coccineum]